ncbi:MAG: hypothetical protein ACYSVY_01085 [Planctomycetota bacterium]
MKYVARITRILKPGICKISTIEGGAIRPVADFPTPQRVEIELEDARGDCMMRRYTDDNEFCGDTWHETLDDALDQAAYEYGLSRSDFEVVGDPE